MSTTRLHPHHSLPAPVVHAGFSVPQSKSHVLAGVQDAYWSDEEAEDAECPLCLEEMDISDLNFKPCICGYQICRFCWHHIKENLNKRCPACRRIYTDEAVEFKPIATQDHKRLTQQKKQRERERKELDALGRRHLANVRVVQRNVAYVVGIGPRFAKEELIPTLRSNEYFGQYGKITKILLVKRTPSRGGAPVVGLYITYHRREDAARAIAAVDGTASPGGGREIMRASYGTTKYCMAFLRGVSCSDHSCMNLHEWGDEKDCFTKEDLTTLKHTMKATESRTRVPTIKKGEEHDGLPRAASWGQKGTSGIQASSSHVTGSPSALSRQLRRGGVTRQSRSNPLGRPTAEEPRTSLSRRSQERKSTVAASTQPSLSRPPTPSASAMAQSTTQNDSRSAQSKDFVPAIQPSNSPAPSATADSDPGSGSQELIPPPSPPMSANSIQSPVPSPSAPAVPPGLSGPPGISSPSRPSRVDTTSPQTPLLSSQSSYQMSNAARALLDDVKARRESALPLAMGSSPFPDFDRTLQTLSGDDGGGFSFNLDPKLADKVDTEALPTFEAGTETPLYGPYVEAYPALRSPPALNSSQFVAPPGIPFPHTHNRSIYDQLTTSTQPPLASAHEGTGRSGYIGSFDPFADTLEKVSASSPDVPIVDEERKVSRFGFARGRQTGVMTPSPLSAGNSDHSLYNAIEGFQPTTSPQWSIHSRQDFGHTQSSALRTPITGGHPHSTYPQPNGFQPFDAELSEAQLRDFIQSSRERAGASPPYQAPTGHQSPIYNSGQHFNDPAIMSASFASSMPETGLNVYGPPPGLPAPQGNQSIAQSKVDNSNIETYENIGSSYVSTTASPALSSTLSVVDFPALVSPTETSPDALEGSLAIEKTSRDKAVQEKAVKKAAAAERAAERQKIAQEKIAAKAAEKAKLVQAKIEKEKEKAEEKKKAEKERLEKERERAMRERERVDKEKAALHKVQQEKVTKVEADQPKEEECVAQLPKLERDSQEKPKVSQNSKENIPVPKKSNPSIDTLKSNKSSQHSSVNTPKIPAKNSITNATELQGPLLSKKPKKNKPTTKPIKISKEDTINDEASTIPSATAEDAPRFPAEASSNNSRSHSLERGVPTSLEELLSEIDIVNPYMDLVNHPFFDLHKLNAAAKMPLEYGPLVHALSALSVGGGSFANNMPTGSIDNAVSSFQQLLETLTQTISDLLRLLPRTTWDDSSSFDGVLRDMLKGDDFLDDGGDEGQGKDDEVAALTLALERRARWMEVQLSKLEELHRDINTAAVRAVLSFNDNGWDRYGSLPRIGNTLRRFDGIGTVEANGIVRSMTADELEKKLAVAKEAAVFAETEVREIMEKLQCIKLFDVEL